MTLEECKRLLKHFNDLANGTIKQPFGHKDWVDVVYNAKLRAVEMEKKIDFLSTDDFRTRRNLPLVEKPKESKPKKEVKKSGSSSNRN